MTNGVAINSGKTMTVTKHISLDEEHIEKMKPYLESNNGNFCIALKEILNREGSSHLNSSAMDASLFNWMITEMEGRLIQENVLDEIMDPGLINSMSKLEAQIRRRLSELEYDIDLVLKYDADRFPSDLLIEMSGALPKIRFVACMLSQYLVKNSLDQAPLGIKYVVNINNCIKIKLSGSTRKEAQKSLVDFFGGMDEAIKAVKTRPAFWKDLIRRHLFSNYNMVTLHRNYLEDLFANKITAGEIMIENLVRKPIQEITLKEMLLLIKEVYETSRIADRVDIDNDTLTISHPYRNRAAVENLKKSLLMLLEASGHLYHAKSTSNMIVLTHRQDVGIKINEIVGNIKMSSNSVDHELIMFMAFLQGLKEIPDIPFSLTALGRRIGRSLMQEYEKENNIKSWDLETFQKVMEIIDSRLQRVSEWKMDGKDLLYTVRKCHIVSEGDAFDAYVCHTSREAFKGALNYAFGNKAELNINKLLTHGDNFCEVVIRIR